MMVLDTNLATPNSSLHPRSKRRLQIRPIAVLQVVRRLAIGQFIGINIDFSIDWRNSCAEQFLSHVSLVSKTLIPAHRGMI